MKKELNTKRLYFQRLKNSDTNDFFQIFGDSDVMKFWIGGADNNIEESEKRIIEINNHWDKHGFGDWGIFEKESETLIGFGGLHYIQNMDDVNIGYAFKKSEWGKGFAYFTGPIFYSPIFLKVIFTMVIMSFQTYNMKNKIN